MELADLFHAGIVPDEIPPVDEPRVERALDVDWLDDDEPVVALSIDGEHRAYPVQILVWHEIVNDTLADVPIAVTYCPLCNSAVTLGRQIERRLVTFGVSGFLYRSALVLYDRQTESLWTQFDREAVAGRLTGTSLRSYPVAMVSWLDFRRSHGRHGTVLSRDTGFERDYGTSRYTGYDGVGEAGLPAADGSTSLAAKARVVGIDTADTGLAVPIDVLRGEHVVHVEVDRRPVVVWWRSGLASALDAERVADGRDVGATGVFDAAVEGRQLTFRADGEGFVDDQTHSRWDVLGRATAGPMTGRRLSPVAHLDTFWFAWLKHRPDTAVVAR